MNINFMRSKNKEEIRPNTDPLEKLSNDIKKKMIGKIVHTTLDLIALACTPVYVNHVLNNIDDKYSSKVIVLEGTVISAYQVSRLIDDSHELRSVIKAYTASMNMKNVEFEETKNDENLIIELEPYQWSIISDKNTSSTVDASDDIKIPNASEGLNLENTSTVSEVTVDPTPNDNENVEDDESGEILYYIRAGEDIPDIDDFE